MLNVVVIAVKIIDVVMKKKNYLEGFNLPSTASICLCLKKKVAIRFALRKKVLELFLISICSFKLPYELASETAVIVSNSVMICVDYLFILTTYIRNN